MKFDGMYIMREILLLEYDLLIHRELIMNVLQWRRNIKCNLVSGHISLRRQIN